MAVRLAPSARQQFLDTAGNPYVGAKLFTYLAGTSTKQATYTTSIGDVANTNPIVLDAAGRTPSGLWLTEGADYKFVLAPAFDTDPPTSAIYTEDNINGVNDGSDLSASLSADAGSSLIGHQPTSGAATTVQLELRSLEAALAARTATPSDYATLADAAAAEQALLITENIAVAASIDLSACELIFTKGGGFTIAAGQTVTIGPISAGAYQVFLGDGSVVFTRACKTCYPEWFGAALGASLTDDVPAIHKAVSAATTNQIEIAFYGEYGLGQQLTLTNGPCYVSSRTAEFQPVSSFANGPIMSGGNYQGKDSLPRISGFSGFGLKLFGSRVTDVYVPLIANCGDGLVIEAQIAAVGQTSVLDCKVTIPQIGNVSRGIVFKTDSESCVFQGNEIYVNFINDFSVAAVDWETTGAAVPHDWDSNKIQIQATDPLPNIGVTVIKGPTTSGISVDRWTISVESWCGGLDSTSKFISGNFNDLSMLLNLAQSPTIDQFQVVGSNNKLNTGDIDGAASTAVPCTDATDTRATFNSGVPLWKRRVKLGATLPVDVGAGATRTFYFYHQCTDKRTQFAIHPGELTTGLNGFMAEVVRDNSAAIDDEVFVVFRNVSGATKVAGTVINFYAEVSGL